MAPSPTSWWQKPVDTHRFELLKLSNQTEQWQVAEEEARSLLADAREEAVEWAGENAPDRNPTLELAPGSASAPEITAFDRPIVLSVSRILADVLYMTGRYDACQAFIRQAVNSGTLPAHDCFAEMLSGWILRRRNQVTAAYELAVRSLSRDHGAMPSEVRGNFLHMRGLCELNMGRITQAREHMQDAVTLCRMVGDLQTQAAALNALGLVERLFCKIPAVMARLEEAIALNRRLGKTDRVAQNFLNLAVLLVKGGQPRRALTMLDETPEVQHLRGTAKRRLMIRLTRAKAHLVLGQVQEARRLARPVLGEAAHREIPRSETLALEVLGDCALAEGRVATARRYYRQGLRKSDHAVAGYMAAGADLSAGLHRRLGQADLSDGQSARAVAHLRRAVRLGRQTREHYEQGTAQYLLARALSQRAQFARAYRAVREAIRVLRDMGAELELAHAQLEAARVRFAWWRSSDKSTGAGEESREHLEVAWSYAVEAMHGFEELAWEKGKQASSNLMQEMRKLAEPPWRARVGLRSRAADAWRDAGSLTSFVAQSAATRRLLALTRVAAMSREPVLVTGETGTGKELVARLIHTCSDRAHGPWVPINCAAVPEMLFERELFGHSKGAFTGAHSNRPGLYEQASGGTLLLDEVGDLPLPLQVKLLRLLQEGTYRRLGDSVERQADVRVVAATNADLSELMAQGRFRPDLYYRLQMFHLCVPPLREREDDVDALITLFLRRAVSDEAHPEEVFEQDVLRALRQYRWPGNVRELEAVTRRLAVMAMHEGRATLAMLPGEIAGSRESEREVPSWWGVQHPPAVAVAENPAVHENLATHLRRAERRRIVQVLTHVQGNRTAAARLLGISRNTLYKKMERLRIDIPR